MDMMERHRMIEAQPHTATASGGVAVFETDVAGNISVTGSGNITVAGRNLYDKSQSTANKFIQSTGAEKDSTTGWSISPYVKVAGLDKITYMGLTVVGTAPYSAWYDSSKTLISTFKQATGRNAITVPSGAAFVRFSIMKGDTTDQDDFAVMPGETSAAFEAYIGTSSQVSRAGYNTVWSDSGDISVTYWTH